MSSVLSCLGLPIGRFGLVNVKVFEPAAFYGLSVASISRALNPFLFDGVRRHLSPYCLRGRAGIRLTRSRVWNGADQAAALQYRFAPFFGTERRVGLLETILEGWDVMEAQHQFTSSGGATAVHNANTYRRLIDVGIALSAEKDHQRLMENILSAARDFTHADAGTLYLKTEQETLSFEILQNDTLNMTLGGTTGRPVTLPDVDLFNEDGTPNLTNVVSASAVTGKLISIADAYKADEFDFSGTAIFDESTGYRSVSFLAVPLKNHEGDVIGVLQLLNAKEPGTDRLCHFKRTHRN